MALFDHIKFSINRYWSLFIWVMRSSAWVNIITLVLFIYIIPICHRYKSEIKLNLKFEVKAMLLSFIDNLSKKGMIIMLIYSKQRICLPIVEKSRFFSFKNSMMITFYSL